MGNEGNKAHKILKYGLSLSVAVLLMYFCFRNIDWKGFWDSLSGCRWEWVGASIAVGVLSNWFRSVRWREMLLPIDSATGRLTVFNAVNIGYLANFALPRIGEFVRCGVVSEGSKGKKAGYDKVLGTVVTERSFDMLVLLLLLFLFLAFSRERFVSFFIDEVWLPFSGRLNFSLWWIVAAAAAVLAAATFLIVRCRHRNPFAAKVCGVFRGIWTGLVSCFGMKDGWRFFILTLLIWATYFLTSYCSMRSVPLLDPLAASDALFLMLAGSIGWTVPVPGGFGAFHYVVALALSSVYGLSFELGIVFATISHGSQSIMMAVTGLISYFSETFRINKTS